MAVADELKGFRLQRPGQGQISHPDADQVPGGGGDETVHILAGVLVAQVDLATVADQPPAFELAGPAPQDCPL